VAIFLATRNPPQKRKEKKHFFHQSGGKRAKNKPIDENSPLKKNNEFRTL